jgi:hypothetical protein
MATGRCLAPAKIPRFSEGESCNMADQVTTLRERKGSARFVVATVFAIMKQLFGVLLICFLCGA